MTVKLAALAVSNCKQSQMSDPHMEHIDIADMMNAFIPSAFYMILRDML